ncbi:uncharacterized protein JN550_003041 [Neoarthrinium moseri]|uniref:uncharacterized protein n=1 Tax=Neoarthrinium moseri TaxID=1658444 RepID=UPI001FDE3A5B|nr:uncharacterized protein JN550_003041 [Neoarthrinium moseri]KAI1873772.1 hypothetical protein JN550_003041 [Neoarthrinium moseri]
MYTDDMGRYLRLPRVLNAQEDHFYTQTSEMSAWMIPGRWSKTLSVAATPYHDFTKWSTSPSDTWSATTVGGPQFRTYSGSSAECVQADSSSNLMSCRRDGQNNVINSTVRAEQDTAPLLTPTGYLYDQTNAIFNLNSSLPSHLVHRSLGSQLITAMDYSSNTWPANVCRVQSLHGDQPNMLPQDHQMKTTLGSNCLINRPSPRELVIDTDTVTTSNSRGYRGNLRLERNRDADIPDEENCRLWLTGIPPDTDYAQLLSFRNVGPVYASHLTEPQLYTRQSDGIDVYSRAASITFFRAEDANHFLRDHQERNFQIDDWKIDMRRHRIRTRSTQIRGRSRILLIKGDPAVVHPRALDSIIRNIWQIYYDVDFLQYEEANGCGRLEIAFGSFRAQAEQVVCRLQNFRPQRIVVEYLKDPCAGFGP